MARVVLASWSMGSVEIPEVARLLIATSIDSVPELEAILLLREHRDHEWTVEETGQRLYVSRTLAAHILDVLARRGFFMENAGAYRYVPATPEIGSAVDVLASAYASNLRDVTFLIHSKPSAAVRQFAEAFRIRKDK